MTKINFKNPTLARAVIKQMGGIEEFKNRAEDIVNHGADGGYGQFVYHKDTVSFAKKNLKNIKNCLSDLANDCDQNMSDIVRNFKCLMHKKETIYSQDEIEKALYTLKGNDSIYNALAWYALEEIAREYIDSLEQ